MRYGSYEYYKENSDYWWKQYRAENERANSAVAEAKKAKERQLSAARLALKYKESDKAIKAIAAAADVSPGYIAFGDAVLSILEELGYEIS